MESLDMSMHGGCMDVKVKYRVLVSQMDEEWMGWHFGVEYCAGLGLGLALALPLALSLGLGLATPAKVTSHRSVEPREVTCKTIRNQGLLRGIDLKSTAVEVNDGARDSTKDGGRQGASAKPKCSNTTCGDEGRRKMCSMHALLIIAIVYKT